MVHLKSCWTPCFLHNNVRDGSSASAVYTAFFSVFMSVYTVYVMTGGDTSQLWLPFFETSLNQGLIPAGVFVLIFSLIFFICSVLMGVGVRTEIRGLIIPWQVCMFLVILFQAIFGLWLLSGYYIYLEVVFVALCCWLWMSLNIYVYLVVRSHYRNLQLFQSPDIEYINNYY